MSGRGTSRERFGRPAGPFRREGIAEEVRYDEVAPPAKEDIAPDGDKEFRLEALMAVTGDHSRALIRIRIEQLLTAREAAPIEQWRALGTEAQDILIAMLDEPDLADRVRHSIIATLGRLGHAHVADLLGAILLDGRESVLTRTFAASALGRVGGDRAVAWLGRALGDPDELVRLQLARSLRRAERPLGIASLRALSADPVRVVADEAMIGLGAKRPASRDGGIRFVPSPEREETEGVGARPGAIALLLIVLGLAIALAGGAYALGLFGTLPGVPAGRTAAVLGLLASLVASIAAIVSGLRLRSRPMR